MAVTRVGSAGALQTGTSSVTGAWGAGQNRTQNNLLTAVVSGYSPNTISTPAGWSLAAANSNGNQRSAIYYKIAAGSDAAPTFTSTSGNRLCCQLDEWTGNTTSSVRRDFAVGTGASNNTCQATSGAYSTGDVIITSWEWYSGTARSFTASYTNNALPDDDDTSLQWHHLAGYRQAADNGTGQTDTAQSGTRNGTWVWVCVTFASLPPTQTIDCGIVSLIESVISASIELPIGITSLNETVQAATVGVIVDVGVATETIVVRSADVVTTLTVDLAAIAEAISVANLTTEMSVSVVTETFVLHTLSVELALGIATETITIRTATVVVGGGGEITRVQSFGNVNSGTNKTASVTITTTAGNFLIVVGTADEVFSGITAFEISGGGTWQQLLPGDLTSQYSRKVWYCTDATGGESTITLTVTDSGSSPLIAFSGLELSNVDSLDSYVSNNGAAVNVSSGATPDPTSSSPFALGFLAAAEGAAVTVSNKAFAPALGSQTDETEQQRTAITAALALISDGQTASQTDETYSLTLSVTELWRVWCVLLAPAAGGAGTQTIDVGVATETLAALALTVVPGAVTIDLGIATETITVRAATPIQAQIISIGVVTETIALCALTVVPGSVTVNLGVATETLAPLMLAVVPGSVTINLGVATETITVRAATPIQAQIISIGVVTETIALCALTVVPGSVTVNLGVATETLAPLMLAVVPGSVTINLGVATETITVRAATPYLATVVDIGYATETITVRGAIIVIGLVAVAETIAVRAATVIIPPTYINLGVATETIAVRAATVQYGAATIPVGTVALLLYPHTLTVQAGNEIFVGVVALALGVSPIGLIASVGVPQIVLALALTDSELGVGSPQMALLLRQATLVRFGLVKRLRSRITITHQGTRITVPKKRP